MSHKALFLDRDGVLNQEKNYVFRISDFEFNKNIFQLCSYFSELDYKIIIVTNQAGIARGYYSIDDFNKLTTWMLQQFKKNSIIIDDIYYCPHHPKFTGICNCRKPEPGLILEAKNKHNLNLYKSILIGDKQSDIQAGRNAGILNNILIKPNSINVEYIISKII